jgi:hypothetical protein
VECRAWITSSSVVVVVVVHGLVVVVVPEVSLLVSVLRLCQALTRLLRRTQLLSVQAVAVHSNLHKQLRRGKMVLTPPFLEQGFQ